MAGGFDQEVLVDSGVVHIVSESSQDACKELFRFEGVDGSEVGEETVEGLCHVRCVGGVMERVLWLVVLF